jgi:hypothetical protein
MARDASLNQTRFPPPNEQINRVRLTVATNLGDQVDERAREISRRPGIRPVKFLYNATALSASTCERELSSNPARNIITARSTESSSRNRR